MLSPQPPGQRQRKSALVHTTTTPTPSAQSATGRQLQIPRRPKRARRQTQIGACTDTSTLVQRGGTEVPKRNQSGLFFWTVHGPFSFPQDGKENGGCIPLDKPPGGSQTPEAAVRRPQFPRAVDNRPYGSRRSDRPAR